MYWTQHYPATMTPPQATADLDLLRRFPVVGFCGYSGSGKTTLIASLVPELCARGLQVAVIKQDSHGLRVDHPGTDSDRLFQAGAEVLIQDATQSLLRRHHHADELPRTSCLTSRIAQLATTVDLILVEGHKRAPLPRKLWLCGPDGAGPPADINDLQASLDWHADRHRAALAVIDACLAETMASTPCYAGILIGGNSRRMGHPKHLMNIAGRSWLEHLVDTARSHCQDCVILGPGTVPDTLAALPRLPDAPEAGPGPLRGLRAAVRWAPHASWLLIACDLPHLSPQALDWLLSQRRPGIHAIIPHLADSPHPEPLLAWYSPRLAPAIEQVTRPRDLIHHQGVISPQIPDHLAQAWRNCNEPGDVG